MSLGNFCRWMAEYAEGLEIDIFPGFTASELILNDGKVVGIATGDMGVDEKVKRKLPLNRELIFLQNTLFCLKDAEDI